MKYEELAKEIVKQVGGVKNIQSLTHCVTRLRFKLKDMSKANDKALEANDEVLSIVKGGGQYMVVIGTHVSDVFREIKEQFGLGGDEMAAEKEAPMGFGNKVIDVLSAVLRPIIGVLCATGILRGLIAMATGLGWLSFDSSAYLLLNGIADATFFFLPILLGHSSAKKFGMDPFVGISLAVFLVYPSLQGVDLTFFGFNFNVDYTYSFLPIIIICLFASYIYKFCDKIMPQLIRYFMTPLITLVVAGALGFLTIGPVVSWISSGILNIFRYLMDISPALSGALLGGFFQVMVMFGIHAVIVFAAIADVLEGNPNFFLAATCLICFSQAASVAAVCIKTKSEKLRSIGIPALISALFGITEPAIYGVTLPRIKLFVTTCIGGAITGLLLGIFNVNYYNFTGDGIFVLPSYMSPENPTQSLIFTLIALVAGAGFSFVCSYILYKDDEVPVTVGTADKGLEAGADKRSNKVIEAPMRGTVVGLGQVPDAAFSSKALGDGVAIEPVEGKVYAPCKGTVTTVFPTGHAIGITTLDGIELLIHIGMDTVKLDGKGFTTKVEVGNEIKPGDLLVEFDLEGLISAGYSPITCIVITNTDNFMEIIPAKEKEIEVGSQLLLVI